jgi:hypothetical protein
MVSVSLFVIIMTISMGAILSIFDASRKSQSLRAVMDNLNYSLEAMTRTIRFGTNYHCPATGTISIPQNCSGENSSIAVMDSNNNQVVYKLVGGQIFRSVNGGSDYSVTSSDVIIDKLTYRVIGAFPYPYSGPDSCPNSNQPDLCQPEVVMTINGHAGAKTTQSSFSLQTTVSQRRFDVQ